MWCTEWQNYAVNDENAQVSQYGAECINWPLPLTNPHSTRYPNQGPATGPDSGTFHEK